MAKNVVHVRINNPVGMRKEILKTAIDSTKVMYAFNEIIELRINEGKLIKKFDGLQKEIKKAFQNLEKTLPVLPDNYEVKSEKTFEDNLGEEKEEVYGDDINSLMKER